MPIWNKPTSKGYRQELSIIIKIYIQRRASIKIIGIALILNLLYKVKVKAFPTMFKGLVLNFFYLNNTINKLSFQDICSTIQTYFKGLEYKRGVLVY